MINGNMASADGPVKTFLLRGIKDSSPYLHDGRPLTLEDLHQALFKDYPGSLLPLPSEPTGFQNKVLYFIKYSIHPIEELF